MWVWVTALSEMAGSPRNSRKPLPASKGCFLGLFPQFFKRCCSAGTELFDFLPQADWLFTVLSNTYQIIGES